jgi:hypothetical protein
MDMLLGYRNIIVDVLCDVKCCSETGPSEFVSKSSRPLRSRISCVNKGKIASIRRTPELDE